MTILPSTSGRKHLDELRSRKRQPGIAISVVLATLMAAATTIISASSQIEPTPMHTSSLTGQAWLTEILYGHPDRCRNALGMSSAIFLRLLMELCSRSGLSDSRYVSAAEKLAIFLYFVRQGASQRQVCERFQRSQETISKAIHLISTMLVCDPFYNKYMKEPVQKTPPQIRKNPKLYPYFRHAIGAIDGSHLAAIVREYEMARHRNRKGFISQNVLAACNWYMLFSYVLSGWEGSAADSHIFEVARRQGHFKFGRPWYFLADAGFPLCDLLLVPYRGVRYHLREWILTGQNGGQSPQNHKELFNLRHAHARNVVERILGIFKRRFKLTTQPPSYPIHFQAKLVVAQAVLFNFICLWDPSDIEEELSQFDEEALRASSISAETFEHNEEAHPPLCNDISSAETERATRRRDKIAKRMWRDYTQHIEQQTSQS